jgi:hypothetical protein
VLQLRLAAQEEVLEPTPPHRFMSEDRQAWVAAGELRVGECLRTASGRAATVESIRLKPGEERVYNLEVEAEHQYFVGLWGVLLHNACNGGRSGKQARLRELGADPNVSSANRGWIQQELNSIARGQRTTIRVPKGMNMAHRRGYEAKKGNSYQYSDLQDVDLHKLQHKHEGY